MLDDGRIKSRRSGISDKQRAILQIFAFGAALWLGAILFVLAFEAWVYAAFFMIGGTLMFHRARLARSAWQDSSSDRPQPAPEPEMPPEGDSRGLFAFRQTRLEWIVALALTATSLITAAVIAVEGPVPERFPEAADAFLYSTERTGAALAMFGVFVIMLGLLEWFKHWRQKKFEWISDSTSSSRWFVTIAFRFGISLCLVSMPLLFRDAASFEAFSDDGFVGRSYWSGAIENEQWSSLQAVEFGCGGDWSPSGRQWPRLYYRFMNGRSIGSVLGMNAFNLTQENAFARLDGLRVRQGVPIVWRTSSLQELFRNGNNQINSCVRTFLSRFPQERRGTLLSMLSK